MAIWINENTRAIVQGITGKAGLFHTKTCLEYSKECIVGGVTPGKGGTKALDLDVFNSVIEAKEKTGCNTSIIFVPPPFAADAILEAEDAQMDLIVCITEGIAINDMLQVCSVMERSKSRLIGPNCPGIISPEICKLGIMPGYIHKKGPLGIVSRSGTLTYEAVWQSTKAGIGQSTCVGIGGDPLIGSDFISVLEAFEQDTQTEAIFLIGEIGGTAEQEAASWIKKNATKPIAAFIAGQKAPEGKRMGHAGAIISSESGKANEKIKALEEVGVRVAKSPSEMGEAIQSLF